MRVPGGDGGEAPFSVIHKADGSTVPLTWTVCPRCGARVGLFRDGDDVAMFDGIRGPDADGHLVIEAHDCRRVAGESGEGSDG